VCYRYGTGIFYVFSSLFLLKYFRKFPEQETFATMIRTAGFRFVTYENLTLGVAAIHSGFKL
jgi:ubiquinone/menaquinone biosynthesis C-methylase UbiE